MSRCVLDSSAVLASIRGEPGGELVGQADPTSIISSVNIAEVVSRLLDVGHDEADAIALARIGGYPVAAFDESLGLRAGALRLRTRHLGLSLGDRACLALAEREGLPVLTADRGWASLDIGVEIRLIR
jgi:ribonuclease VapC